MKLAQLFTITGQYIKTNTKAYRDSKKGGNAKEVAIDFAKFCKKNDVKCKVIQGTFRLDKKQENGSKEVEHYWNVIEDGMFDTGNNSDEKYPMITDFSVKPSYEDTGLATDNSKTRYTMKKELSI
jgi:hypothetical protein